MMLKRGDTVYKLTSLFDIKTTDFILNKFSATGAYLTGIRIINIWLLFNLTPSNNSI